MDGFAFLIAVVTFVMALVALHKISRLQTRIFQLNQQVEKLSLHALQSVKPQPEAEAAEPVSVVPMPEPAAAPAEAVVPEEAEPSIETTEPMEEPVPAAAPVAAPPPRDMEQALAGRWFVWIGGVAIAIGGLLFVKYAYDNGLIPPSLQVILGLVAGLALAGAGEWVRRRSPPAEASSPNYVPAALSAAGLAVIFASIYAAYALYEILAPSAAFLGLAATGLGAMGLSRRQGPLIAALGLIGSYVTPMLIPSADPSAWSFFPYLLVILLASLFTLRGRRWWWLGHAAVIATLLWTVLWLLGPYEPQDVWPVGLSALVLGLAAMLVPGGFVPRHEEFGGGAPAREVNGPLAIGLGGLSATVFILIMLAFAASHSAPALFLLSTGLAILVALAWMRAGLSFLAPVAGLVMLLVLAGWQEAAFHALTLDENGTWSWSSSFGPESARFLRWMMGCAMAFTLAGTAGVLSKRDGRNWGVLGGAAGFLFLWGAWARADFLLSDTTWALLAAGFAALLLLATAGWGRRAEAGSGDLGAGLLSAGAAALLAMALDRLLDGVWFTVGLAALALVYAALTHVLKPRLLASIAVTAASLAAARLFLARELWFDDRTLAWGQHWVIYGYGLPLILAYAASRVLWRSGHERAGVALEGISLGLAISLVSLEIRVLIGGGYLYEEPQFLEMAAHVLTWAGAAYGLMHRQRLFSSAVSLWGARALLLMSFLAVILLSLLAFNPVLTGEPVPGGLVLNAILLAYLAPVPLIGLIALRLDAIGWQQLRPVAGVLALVLLFAYVTVQTKRIFQGAILTAWSQSLAETYAYSAVWLAFALALFVAGIRLGRQPVRLAGLAVLALVVLKVFIGDMSNLEGLYRIASFVGLGLCLVGIGWLYQHFVRQPEAARA
ncbi:DUF2339 domain-containing protein [Aestuariivirga sp.]|uniref:DUF2339 domain-containing protein n=1 Tax=Aestuariivirga sp. TaxID=2650926 RepID=UPI00391C7D6B